MLLPKLNSHSRCSLACALLVVVAALSIACVRAVAAEAVTAAGEGPRSLAEPQSLPLVQVTTDPAADNSPALVQAADGKLLTVFERNGNLWSRISADGGATWGAETQFDKCCRSRPSLARSANGNLWLTFDRDGDIWYRTSPDNGLTWSAEWQLTTDPSGDFDPAVFQAADGKMWVVWASYRTGNLDIWYKTSPDGGVTWTADMRLSTSNVDDYAPAGVVASGGRLMVVWNRGSGELWQINSSNNGATWSVEKQVAGCCRSWPSLAAVGEVLWLAYEQEGDIWYRTSANQGTTWSAETSFTRFVGPDAEVTLAALASGRPGLVWRSLRSANPDIWFGSPGELADVNPPPYVEWIEHWPQCNPDSDDNVTFRALALDETGMASVRLVWTLNGTAQPDLEMFDDGANGDDTAGDSIWGVQPATLPAGSQVTYTVRATDTDGNPYLYAGQRSFTVQPPFIKTADILFVPDYGGDDTSWLRSYYTGALEAQGYRYDTWDTGFRCAPDNTILSQYIAGSVIWAMPFWGYAANGSNDTISNLRTYLDAGGRLFITGQNIAEYLSWSGGGSFLNDYLHASFVQGDTGLYALSGTAGDPIGDGLALNISGGDGANKQYSKDEVDPIAPADVIFTYQGGVRAMLAEPDRPEEKEPATTADAYRALVPEAPGTRHQPGPPADLAESTPSAGCGDSCTAGLRVDTGVYKVVYLAFGFEAINNAAHRACVMGRVMGWLNDTPPAPCMLTPSHGQVIPAGSILFSWTGMPGVTGYEIQIDTVPTFDSPALIDAIVTGASYTRNFTAHNTWHWRVRALLGGEWTAAWSFSVSSDVVQVTTDPADDTSPTLAQTADGKLLTAFVRNGRLWSRASADGGAMWAAETQIAGCCRYNPSLARGANGTLWLAYDRDSDIWYRSSADHGVTWTAERKLPTDPNSTRDYNPVILQAGDGRLWVVWNSDYRSDYYLSIWYKTSTDGGATWSADMRLTGNAYDLAPTAAVAPDGRVVVVWQRYSELWQRSSSDGGANWSDEKLIAGAGGYKPTLTTVGGNLWLVYARDDDIRYRISTDNGDTWSDETRFTRFVGRDDAPAAAALASGSAGIVWTSARSGNPDIWFGIPGERDDLNPPPYIEWLDHQPAPNPDSDDPITFRARSMDETGVGSVHLVWMLNGIAQADLPMYDDGTHCDNAAGDGVWCAEHAPLPAGSQVTYRARATDVDGNSYRYPALNSFKVLLPFVKTAAILFVPDAGGNNTPSDTTWFQSYYTDALKALGYRYDIWDTELRGAPGSSVLNQYTHGAVIWAVPYWGFVTESTSGSTGVLQAFLDLGGRLFITGQNVAEGFRWSGPGFLTDYLHATFRAIRHQPVCPGRRGRRSHR